MARAFVLLLVALLAMACTSSPPAGSWCKNEIVIEMDDSLGLWAEPTTLALGTWIETGLTPQVTINNSSGNRTARDGRNVIVFAPITASGHEDDLAVTVWWTDDETGETLEADVVLNTNAIGAFADLQVGDLDVDGVNGPSDCVGLYDIQNVMTHEGGHFFGIHPEEETNKDATMYKESRMCEVRKRTLTEGDVLALKESVIRTCGRLPSPGMMEPEERDPLPLQNAQRHVRFTTRMQGGISTCLAHPSP